MLIIFISGQEIEGFWITMGMPSGFDAFPAIGGMI
jgi:hypothetical protein